MHYLLALFGGVLVALGLPPLSLWPLVFAGLACYIVASERAPSRPRMQFVLGLLFAWGWLAPAMGWMWQLVPGGFVVAPLLFAVLHGVAAVVASAINQRASSRHIHQTPSRTANFATRAAAHVLVECLRFVTPFGGVPLAGLALSVADTRLAQLVRLVGPLGLALWIFLFAGVWAELWMRRREIGWRSRRPVLMVLTALVVLQGVAQLAPRGRDTGETLRIAVVQGGGPQGVLAVNSNPRDVIDRHLAATALLNPSDRLDLVVWPENAIDVRDFTTSKVRDEIVTEVQRIGAPFAVGVTEDAGAAFTNAQILIDRDGIEQSRYDKVRRVPYGEYIPLRGLLAGLGAPVDRIPRDAVAGTTPAVLMVPHGNSNVSLAVAISWEIFFSGRVNDGVSAGGQVVLNPTNGSSYTGEILQQQQVATSQLRALESGRFVVQAATTGYSLIVDADGRVLQRIPIGQQAVIFADVPLRSGQTLYSRFGYAQFGDLPLVIMLIAFVACVAWRSRKTGLHINHPPHQVGSAE